MKKIIILLLFTTWLIGCQKKEEVKELSQINTFDELLSIEIIKTNSTTQLEPSNKNTLTQSMTAEENHVFVDLLVKINNISTKQFKLKDIFSEGEYRVDGMSYDMIEILETVDYTKLTTTDSIKANQERFVHLYCQVPIEVVEKEFQLNVKILDKHKCYYKFTVEEHIEQHNFQSIGDVISLKDTQLTFNQISQSKKIEPSNKGIFYSYIPTDNQDETFVFFQIDVRNLSKEDIDLEDYLYCEYILGDETYKSQFIIESENHKSLDKTTIIDSLQTRTVYIAVPIKDNQLSKKGVFQLFVEGENFQIEYK